MSKKSKDDKQTSAKPQQISLGDKINALDSAVEWFYSEDFNLAEAIDRYEKASVLAKSIEDDLKTLKNKISVIEQDFSQE